MRGGLGWIWRLRLYPGEEEKKKEKQGIEKEGPSDRSGEGPEGGG